MSYSFLNSKLWKYIGEVLEQDENHLGTIKGYSLPLVDQPGENFTYSVEFPIQPYGEDIII
jgi:hypothetical protein